MTTTAILMIVLIPTFIIFILTMLIITCAEVIIATIVYLFDLIVGMVWKRLRGYSWIYLYKQIRMFFSKILLPFTFAIISVTKIADLYMKKHPKQAKAYLRKYCNKNDSK